MPSDLDISQILPHLYIAAHPRRIHAGDLVARGTRLIICMIFFLPPQEFRRPPLSLLWLPSFDDPFLPIPIERLYQGVCKSLPGLARDESVVIYCRQGRHRSVAMCCAILIGLGYSAEAAMELVQKKRPSADPRAAHIERVITRFEGYWRRRQEMKVGDESLP